MVQQFLELLDKNVALISEQRTKLKDKSLREPAKLTQHFLSQLSSQTLPLEKEADKLA